MRSFYPSTPLPGEGGRCHRGRDQARAWVLPCDGAEKRRTWKRVSKAKEQGLGETPPQGERPRQGKEGKGSRRDMQKSCQGLLSFCVGVNWTGLEKGGGRTAFANMCLPYWSTLKRVDVLARTRRSFETFLASSFFFSVSPRAVLLCVTAEAATVRVRR